MTTTQYRIMRTSMFPDGAPVPIGHAYRITDLEEAQDLVAEAKAAWAKDTPSEMIPTFWIESRVISEWEKVKTLAELAYEDPALYEGNPDVPFESRTEREQDKTRDAHSTQEEV